MAATRDMVLRTEGTQNVARLSVPVHLLRRANGFAMDMGGSLLKLVYMHQEEWGPTSRDQGKESAQGNLYVTSFPRDSADEILAYIKKHVFIRREPDAVPTITTTGVGLNNVGELFSTELNIKLVNIIETDCFVLAARFLLDQGQENTVTTRSLHAAVLDGIRAGRTVANAFNTLAVGNHTKWRSYGQNIEDFNRFAAESTSSSDVDTSEAEARGDDSTCKLEFPYLLGQLGSGFGFIKVFEDNSFDFVDLTPFAGRTFLDLGRLLTGARTFEDLAALAETGQDENIHHTASDLITPDVKDDSYSTISSELVVYSFGKTQGKDLNDVSKADLARALLQTICGNYMNIAHHVMHKDGIRDLYLAGSFAKPDVSRCMLAKEFEVYRGFHLYRPTTKSRLHIFELAGDLGAIGAFIQGCDDSDANK